MNDLYQSLEALLGVVSHVVRNDPVAIRQLDAMTGNREIPSLIADLAEQINHLAVQKEARELRLERMVEDLLEAQAALEQARHDPLTGLANRGLFHEFLRLACAETLRSGEALALMFIDLDKFKQVNDTLGHAAGDELLVQVAQRLRECVRDGDILGRLGGDEFGVVVARLADKETGIRVARRIIEDLRTTFPLTMGDANIGGSIGISFFPDDADQSLSLLKNADIAMYKAKDGGRNGYRLYKD